MFTKIFKEKDYLVPNYVFWDIKKLFALDNSKSWSQEEFLIKI